MTTGIGSEGTHSIIGTIGIEMRRLLRLRNSTKTNGTNGAQCSGPGWHVKFPVQPSSYSWNQINSAIILPIAVFGYCLSTYSPNHLLLAFRLFLPQICLTLLCVVYLWISALIFSNLDQSLADQSIYEIILFEFSALTTIGYGNIAPSSNAARAFCVLFALFGMPLLYLTLANFGKHASKGYWYLMSSLGQKAALSHISKDSPMPLPVILFLFVLTFLIGSHSIEHTGERGTIDEIYFSFISFATVGFGDKTPKVPTFRQLCITVAYLTWGCILTTTLFTVLSQYFRKVQYLGRRFTGTRDVSVWMGGRKMTVSRLVQVIANEFDASPREIRSMLRDLDEIIPRQIEDLQEEEKFSRTPLIAEFDDFEYIDE